jgi:hypothetical protein
MVAPASRHLPISATCSSTVSGASELMDLVVDPLRAHSRMTGVSAIDFLGDVVTARAAGPATVKAPAPATDVVMNCLLFMSTSPGAYC